MAHSKPQAQLWPVKLTEDPHGHDGDLGTNPANSPFDGESITHPVDTPLGDVAGYTVKEEPDECQDVCFNWIKTECEAPTHEVEHIISQAGLGEVKTEPNSPPHELDGHVNSKVELYGHMTSQVELGEMKSEPEDNQGLGHEVCDAQYEGVFLPTLSLQGIETTLKEDDLSELNSNNMMKHSGGKSNKCDLCEKQFAQAANLKKQMMINTREQH